MELSCEKDKSVTYPQSLLWFDENVFNEENKIYFDKLRTIFINIKGFQSLDKGFENFYQCKNKNYQIILVIVSGKFFGKFIKKLKDNLNNIINIPYTFIFTSTDYKNILLNSDNDKENILSYDTKISINNGFYNPGGVYDNFDVLFQELISSKKKMNSYINIVPRSIEKINYEGIMTFEYLESEEDLLAPSLYKDIIVNEEITEEDCIKFHQFILSFNEEDLNYLIQKLTFFKYIPRQILSKYWTRCYTIESNFYKLLNNNLMKSKLTHNYKTFIKMLYTGIEIDSLNSYHGQYLYRGSVINKDEVKKINEYIKNEKLSLIVVFSKAFLSFSEDKNSALGFCGKSDNTKIGCLYVLENNKKNLHESNADIQNISVFPDEKEILFFPGSSFIIKDIKELNNNKIEIILNYNGKFKEKYSFIYNNKEKINTLINNNIFTKNIAGKELLFLKGGKYLLGEQIDELGTTFKGKNLETDEIVSIKKISKNFEHINTIIDTLKKISKRIPNSIKFKEYFESENYYYIIQNYYDDNLEHFMSINKKLTPNFIHKIFKQLEITFENLLGNNTFITVRPSNILIRYCNPEKTNFDSFFSDYFINNEENIKNKYNKINKKKIFYDKPSKCNMYIPHKYELEDEDLIEAENFLINPRYYSKFSSYLYSIGLTIYYLYFGKLPYSKFSLDEFNKLLDNPQNINVTIETDKNLEDLINKILKKDIKDRIDWKGYFSHPFFKQYKY